jgi:hypothetical protein
VRDQVDMSDAPQLIEDCEHRSERLNSWQTSFIDSIGRQLVECRPLTVKQYEALSDIWAAATAKG